MYGQLVKQKLTLHDTERSSLCFGITNTDDVTRILNNICTNLKKQDKPTESKDNPDPALKGSNSSDCRQSSSISRKKQSWEGRIGRVLRQEGCTMRTGIDIDASDVIERYHLVCI